MQVQNNTFLVTGGASGLGEATTRYLVAHGANIIIADLNQEAGEKLVAELGDNVTSPAKRMSKMRLRRV